ncbi:MAG: type II secretion system F family protein [Halofilum sp. (in: g-proteobacteria)]|nr:type II secretion system F family protein [Halofilum sp. (in: g-proteobacteria)]
MESFRYRAVDAGGRRVTGAMAAVNTADLELRLARLGLDLVRCRARGRGVPTLRRRRVPRAELIHFTFHLEQLLGAGVPLVEALSDLATGIDDPSLRDVVAALVEAIEGGQTLSQALAGFPGVFGGVYVAMVRVGEQSGRLAEILRNLTDMLRRQEEMIADARRIMVYPAIVLAVVGAVIVFLMIYLVPALTDFLGSMGAALPLHTRALIATSRFLVHWWWLLLLLVAALPLALRWLVRRSPRWRYRWDRLRLRVWLFGALGRKVRLARFAQCLALMYASGMPVLDALRLCGTLMDNTVLEHAIDRGRERIAAGETISQAFAGVGLFPPLVVRMMRVGETSGALDEALHNVGAFYAREVRDAIEHLQPAIQPLLTVILGALVAWIMLSVVGPLYDTIGTLDY